MAGDFPVEEDVFHLWPLPDVVNDQVTAGQRRFLVHYHSDMRDSSSEIPGDQVAGMVIGCGVGKRKRLAVPAEKDHQIRNAAMIDVGIGRGICCAVGVIPFAGIGGEMRGHILVNFFLQVDPDSSVGSDDLVGANASAGGNVATGVGNAHIGGIVPNDVVGALDGGRDETIQKKLLRWRKLRDVGRGCRNRDRAGVMGEDPPRIDWTRG